MSASSQPRTTDKSSQAKPTTLSGKLAALTGAAGVALSGDAVADPIYVPTAGVKAAQNIPGFSFTPPTTVTPGAIRPPPSLGNNLWDVDGDGNDDFALINFATTNQGAALYALGSVFTANLNKLFGRSIQLNSLIFGAPVGPANTSLVGVALMTVNGTSNVQANAGGGQFFTNSPGFFGFRFAFGNDPNQFYYGWGSLTIDLANPGQGFKITDAFYQSTSNTAINVGEVPLDGPAPVPELSGEPSGIALLAAGVFGLEAWRNRRRRQPGLAC
jgi:hypothetical protein